MTCLVLSSPAQGQPPQPSPEHAVLAKDVGTWDAEAKFWISPDTAPVTSKGVEKNVLLGNMWLISEYKSEADEMVFEGHGQFGYDPVEKKYVGTWIDSFSPNITKMVGTYDADKKAMTFETTGVGMDGSTTKGKNVVVYGQDERVMTMYVAAPGTDEMIKVMEVAYSRAK